MCFVIALIDNADEMQSMVKSLIVMSRNLILLFVIIFILLGFLSFGMEEDKIVICDYVEESESFPDDFLFGTSTSAYQIEGGWDADGKGISIWDATVHDDPTRIIDGSNADVGADSYHHYKDDMAAMKNIGFNFYRFSIAWTRILPAGDLSVINEKGLQYYHNVIDECLRAGIEPMVTMYHLDLPQVLQDLGGWANPIIVQYFKAYAEVLFENYGGKISRWMTFNEPFDACVDGYGRSDLAPFITGGEYLCGHHVLMAHAATYHLYAEKYRPQFGGKVGITLNSRHFYPKDGVNVSLTERGMQYMLGWFAEPIFSDKGGYPTLMVDEIRQHSHDENLSTSRLPFMDVNLKLYIRGTADFLSFNYYTSNLVTYNDNYTHETAHWDRDARLIMTADPHWKQAKTDWIYNVPQGLGDTLRFIRDRYNNPEILITENGWSDDGQLEDYDRITYLRAHLAQVLRAKNCDNVNLIGFGIWSLVDNFEWLMGYTEHFGLHKVNMTSPDKERIPKLSTKFVKNLIKTRKLN